MNQHINFSNFISRRDHLQHLSSGAASIGLMSLFQNDLAANTKMPLDPQIDNGRPYAARKPHFKSKAKRMIQIFCSGALSHLDTFDYKPDLIKYDGKPMPSDKEIVNFQGKAGNLTKSPYEFKRRGQCGKMISELVGKIGDHADDICFLHSMTSETNTHGPAENFMSTGSTQDGFPSNGSWISYALGSVCQNLPAFVALPDPRGVPQAKNNNWGSGFLPAPFQGTPFNTTKPIRNLKTPNKFIAAKHQNPQDYLKFLNDEHLKKFPGDSECLARIASYELAAKMQLSVPDVMDLSSESDAIKKLYGADDTQNKTKREFANNCILARRLLEQDVRVVQLFNGAYAMGEGVGNWDGHKHLKKQYDIHGPILDQPIAALLTDLKQRGMMEDTLVVFCTEFGRTPTFQLNASGRDHNPAGFTCWLAGAGVKAPFSYGATDEFGGKAINNVASVYDFHATILTLLGLDHERLSYLHNGFRQKLTNVHGHVIHDVLA